MYKSSNNHYHQNLDQQDQFCYNNCVVYLDPDPNLILIQHICGSGSKPNLKYLLITQLKTGKKGWTNWKKFTVIILNLLHAPLLYIQK